MILFFGGWDLPFVLDQHQAGWIPAIAKLAVISAKVGAMIVFIMWIRWTLPRFRYDTLMDMARTTVNLVGNCLATCVMARWEGEFGKEQPWNADDTDTADSHGSDRIDLASDPRKSV